MSYTLHKNPEMEQQVTHDLQMIQDHLLKTYHTIEGLILVGGFGRGEGGLVLQDGVYRPENDYDLEMITTQAIDPKNLHQTERHLAKTLGVRWVHIENRQRQNLPHLPFTQYVYDLKYGGQVLYGPSDLLDEIPVMLNKHMPQSEGEKLLHTRLWCFLGPYSSEFETRAPTQAETIFMVSQMSKALLAICDANLILNHNYQVHYAQKSATFLNDSSIPEDLKSLILWATKYKLTPHEAEIPEPLPLYHTVRHHYLKHLFHFAQSVRKMRFKDWMDYGKYFEGWVTQNPTTTRIKRRIKSLLGRSLQTGQYEDLVRLKLYMVVAGAVTDKERYLQEAKRIVDTYSTPTDSPSTDWETLRKKTLSLLNI